MPSHKKTGSSLKDCCMPTAIEIPQICFHHKNEYIDTPCETAPIRVPKLKCIPDCAIVECPKIEIGPCEPPKICYKETVVDKPRICLAEKKCEITKPCIEYRSCQLLKAKPCRLDVNIVKPCIKPMKPPKICCEPCPIKIPRIQFKPVKCCIPATKCCPIEVDCVKLCDKPVNIEIPKFACKLDPIKITVPILGPLKLPPDC